MDFYYSEGTGELTDPETARENPQLVIIEDPNMVYTDEYGQEQATFKYIDALTLRVHPKLMAAFLEDAEMLWTADEVFAALS